MTEHSNIPKLKTWYETGKLSRRDFLRQATLLGMSASAAYSFIGLAVPGVASAQNLPKGGTIRMGMRVLDVSNAHAIAFEEAGKAGKILSDTCQKNGLIVRPILDTVALCPPLIISEKEVDELTDKLKKSLQEAKDEIIKVH